MEPYDGPLMNQVLDPHLGDIPYEDSCVLCSHTLSSPHYDMTCGDNKQSPIGWGHSLVSWP